MSRNRVLTLFVLGGLFLANRLLRDTVPNISRYIVAAIALWLFAMFLHWFWWTINRPDNVGINLRNGFLFSIGLGFTFALVSILVTFGFCRDAQAGLVVIGGPFAGVGLGIVSFPVGWLVSWVSKILAEKIVFSQSMNRSKLIAMLGCLFGLILSIIWVVMKCKNKLGFFLVD